MISFRRPFSDFTPDPFPLNVNVTLIAPFWADVNLFINGAVYYRFTQDEQLLSTVKESIRNAFIGDFSPDLLFVATWVRVAEFGGSSSVVSELFMNSSYAPFTPMIFPGKQLSNSSSH